ncbi:MAG: type II secretion system F family protein [Candidatus Micrarchaeota archaeon]|nr:type II secretion system F family protein [Candidatus Micrarchaeota archaeon]
MGIGNPLILALVASLTVSMCVFMFCLVYPRWLCNKKISQMDKDLLFAARHLRVQTTAGVPLFESLVSASHGYGIVSTEFDKVVTHIEAGASMADALEESATKNPSYYYSRILWQMSNAVKAGTDIGPVLSDIVEFLSEEQRIAVRNYGAQLNSIAIMYLMVCIIVPTISLIFIMVISSFVEIPITDTVLYGILGSLVFVQYMFIGLIESRRPSVSI